MCHPSHPIPSKAIAIALASVSLVSANVEQSTTTTKPDVAKNCCIQNQMKLAPLSQDEKLTKGRLENGFSYIIRPTAEPKGRASLRLYIEAGSLDETKEISGISHFLEHLMFNGSRNFKRGELIPAMQTRGLGFGGDANAYTSLLETVYMLDLPSLEGDTPDFALTVMRDFCDGATLTDEAIDKERGIIMSELSSRDSLSYRTSIKLLEQITRGARASHFLPIGTPEMIQGAPYAAFRKYYNEYYTPDRQTLIITGDIDKAQAEDWVKKHFSSMAPRKGAPRPALGVPQTDASVCVVPNSESALSSIAINIPSVWTLKPDTIEQRMADLPLNLAIKMLNTRFSRMAKDADSPFLQASVSQSDVIRTSEVFGASAVAKPELWQKALTALENETRRAAEFGFQPQEVKEAVAALSLAHDNAISSWSTYSGQAMAKTLIDDLGEGDVMTSPMEDKRAFVEGLKLIMADLDLCRSALAAAYDESKASLSLSGTLAPNANEEVLKKSFEAACTQKLSAPVKMEELVFAYDKIAKPGKIVQRAELADIGVTTLTLSNGIRVNLKPVDFDKGSISVVAALDGGVLALPRTSGLALFASSVMGTGGLEAHSMEELKSLLAGKKLGMSFELANEHMNFSGTTRIEDLEMQCQLLAAMILHPGYRPEAEMMLRRMISTVYNRMETTPDGSLKLEGMRKIFGDDPRLVFPSQDELEALSTTDVKAALAPLLKDGAIEVSLVGDFKVEEVLPILERSFGSMPARKAQFAPLSAEQRAVSLQMEPDATLLPYKTEIDKTQITQIRPMGDGMDIKRNRRVAVLSAITRDKLFDGIRAVLGEAYSPSVRYIANAELSQAAYMTVTSLGVERNYEIVNDAINSILSEMGQDSITKEDFERAIRPILTSLDKKQRQTSFWVSAINRLQSDPDKLADLREELADAATISHEEIVELAQEVFGKSKSYQQFIIVPERLCEEKKK